MVPPFARTLQATARKPRRFLRFAAMAMFAAWSGPAAFAAVSGSGIPTRLRTPTGYWNHRLRDAIGHSGALRRRIGATPCGGTGDCCNTGAPRSGRYALLRDFARGEGLEFQTSVIGDRVMGGLSEGSVRPTSEGVLFEGSVTRRGGGGFASLRFQPEDTRAFKRLLRTACGVNLTIGRASGCLSWKFQLSEMPGLFSRGTQWQADFQTAEDVLSVQIPFSSLVPTRFGKAVSGPGLPNGAADSISSFGLVCSYLAAGGLERDNFVEGPFALTVSSVELF